MADVTLNPTRANVNALTDPKLRRQLTSYAWMLTRGWRNREEEVADLLAYAYFRAVERWQDYDPERGGLLKWMTFFMRTAVQAHAIRRSHFGHAIQLEDAEWQGSVATRPAQEASVLLKEVLRINRQATQSETGAQLILIQAAGWDAPELGRLYGRSKQRIQQIVKRQRARILEAMA